MKPIREGFYTLKMTECWLIFNLTYLNFRISLRWCGGFVLLPLPVYEIGSVCVHRKGLGHETERIVKSAYFSFLYVWQLEIKTISRTVYINIWGYVVLNESASILVAVRMFRLCVNFCHGASWSLLIGVRNRFGVIKRKV